LCRVCGPAKKRRKEGCIMRKISLILLVLLMAAPVWANGEVLITCSVDGNEVTVHYNATTSRKVRAFALDITVDSGVISDVNDKVNPDYTIYPGSIVITGGVVTDDGNAVADPCDYPSDTQPGVGSGGITVEMGALYSPPDDANGPPWEGDLLTFRVSENCHITIEENGVRGGVVLTDPTLLSGEDFDVNAPGCDAILDCFPSSYTTYNDWVTMGSPDCWCAKPIGSGYQCDGDADGATYGYQKYRVFSPDFNILGANWKKKIDDPTLDPCADFDHKPYGYQKYRVFSPDFIILVNSWKAKDTDLPGDCPRPE